MPICVNIRGTSGSGKSTVVTRVMENYPVKKPLFIPDRRRPIGYLLERPGELPLHIVGHYEIACGGCDTLKTVDETYERAGAAMNLGHNVIIEGLMLGEDASKAVAFARSHELIVINLNTPIDDCIAAVKGRRAARGNEKPLNEKNTRARANGYRARLARLKDAGVKVETTDREGAYLRVLELLKGEPV